MLLLLSQQAWQRSPDSICPTKLSAKSNITPTLLKVLYHYSIIAGHVRAGNVYKWTPETSASATLVPAPDSAACTNIPTGRVLGFCWALQAPCSHSLQATSAKSKGFLRRS